MSIQDEVRGVLPLTVAGVGISDPSFNLYGDGWNLNVNCDWSLKTVHETMATSDSEETELARALERLVGLQLVDAGIDDGLLDPVFQFEGALSLALVSDTDLDPWVFRAEGMAVTLVGRGPEGHREWLNQQSD